jgi:hypothetical protein
MKAIEMNDGADYGPTTPIVADPRNFDHDLQRFMEWTASDKGVWRKPLAYDNPWFSQTAEPLFVANEMWKLGGINRQSALNIVEDKKWEMAPDWRRAAIEWMQRRFK